MIHKGKRVMISALKSGSGKTAVTCALLSALKNRGLDVRAGKCGPDYIDPMFYREILGIPPANFDPYFEDAGMMREYYVNHSRGGDITVLEGVMGYYDGLSFENPEGSTYECAVNLGCPVILVVDGRGTAYTITGVIKGAAELKADSNICGVIINNVSPGVYERMAPVIFRETGIRPLGCFPYDKGLKTDSRHLGLVTPDEDGDTGRKLRRLGEAAERFLDIEEIISIAGNAEDIEYNDRHITNDIKSGADRKKVAVAFDRAFSFYYEENLQLLRSMGCDLMFFSPLKDASLPDGAEGLILGGGYPEHYAAELSENRGMRESIRTALEDGLPCLAECGGFMYLHERLEDEKGIPHGMTGFIRGETAYRTGKLQRFGYVSLSPEKPNPFLYPGETIRGHEFHYWASTDNGDLMRETKPSDRTGQHSFTGMHLIKNTFCGFPHLFYPSCPEFAGRFAGLL